MSATRFFLAYRRSPSHVCTWAYVNPPDLSFPLGVYGDNALADVPLGLFFNWLFCLRTCCLLWRGGLYRRRENHSRPESLQSHPVRAGGRAIFLFPVLREKD